MGMAQEAPRFSAGRFTQKYNASIANDDWEDTDEYYETHSTPDLVTANSFQEWLGQQN